MMTDYEYLPKFRLEMSLSLVTKRWLTLYLAILLSLTSISDKQKR